MNSKFADACDTMMKNKKTVFFGPFVGEFGWELLYWHGWVKRLCKTRYADYHKIACSYPGRYPFYPYVNEFLPLPEKFLKNPISARGYITDCWTKSFPMPDTKPFDLPDTAPLVNEVIEGLKKKLPEDTEFVIPWELRYDKDDKQYYGVTIPENPTSDAGFVTYKIPFSNQLLEPLQPTSAGLKILKTMINPDERLIAIIPRYRVFRRPDKNWVKERYVALIHELQRRFPQFKIAVIGEPGGAFFADGGIPAGCIDLIQVDPNHRMDVHVSALKQSVIGIGSQSGGVALALATGCQTLTWGIPLGEKGFLEQNYARTRVIFYPSINPSITTILSYTKWMLGLGRVPSKEEMKRLALSNLYRSMPRPIRRSKTLSKIRKSFKME